MSVASRPARNEAGPASERSKRWAHPSPAVQESWSSWGRHARRRARRGGLGRARQASRRTEAPATQAGYEKLLAWAEGFGSLELVGLEGSGSFGVGLARYLHARGVEVVEVNRPNRQHRRRFGKHDTADAEAAARAVQAGAATGEPKSADGPAEMVRVLHVVRRSAVKARTQATNQLRALLVTAPGNSSGIARSFHGQAGRHRGALPSGWLSRRGGTATKLAMRSVARRHQRLSEEIAELEEQIERLVAEYVPALASLRGVGTDTAASLLVAVGDNPERLKSEAAFARLCGVAPLEASSGKTVRHRLNRGGNRDANRALHVLALGRMSWDERPENTWPGAPRRARAEGRSCGASSATSPARFTESSRRRRSWRHPRFQRYLDRHRNIAGCHRARRVPEGRLVG